MIFFWAENSTLCLDQIHTQSVCFNLSPIKCSPLEMAPDPVLLNLAWANHIWRGDYWGVCLINANLHGWFCFFPSQESARILPTGQNTAESRIDQQQGFRCTSMIHCFDLWHSRTPETDLCGWIRLLTVYQGRAHTTPEKGTGRFRGPEMLTDQPMNSWRSIGVWSGGVTGHRPGTCLRLPVVLGQKGAGPTLKGPAVDCLPFNCIDTGQRCDKKAPKPNDATRKAFPMDNRSRRQGTANRTPPVSPALPGDSGDSAISIFVEFRKNLVFCIHFSARFFLAGNSGSWLNRPVSLHSGTQTRPGTRCTMPCWRCRSI